MTWPANVVVSAVFIPIYIVLFAGSLFNVFKHGHGKALGFISLAVFSFGESMPRVMDSVSFTLISNSLFVSLFKVRTIGDILLVAAYKKTYDITNVVEWGYILQSLGYTFFLSATLDFYQRAKYPDTAMIPSVTKGIRGILANPSPPKILQLITTIGFILLIVGYTDSDGIFPFSTSGTSTTSDATLNVKAKIGD